MSGEVDLLSCEDEKFDVNIESMDLEELISTVSLLQTAMEEEQEVFNNLSARLAEIQDQDSPEFNQVSAELMSSQTRLASLMNRNMKCFTQQEANHNNEIMTDNVDFTEDVEYTPENNDSVQNGNGFNGHEEIREGSPSSIQPSKVKKLFPWQKRTVIEDKDDSMDVPAEGEPDTGSKIVTQSTRTIQYSALETDDLPREGEPDSDFGEVPLEGEPEEIKTNITVICDSIEETSSILSTSKLAKQPDSPKNKSVSFAEVDPQKKTPGEDTKKSEKITFTIDSKPQVKTNEVKFIFDKPVSKVSGEKIVWKVGQSQPDLQTNTASAQSKILFKSPRENSQNNQDLVGNNLDLSQISEPKDKLITKKKSTTEVKIKSEFTFQPDSRSDSISSLQSSDEREVNNKQGPKKIVKLRTTPKAESPSPQTVTFTSNIQSKKVDKTVNSETRDTFKTATIIGAAKSSSKFGQNQQTANTWKDGANSEIPTQKNGTDQTDFQGVGSGDKGFTGDEKVEERVTLIDWDPKKLLLDMYKVELQPDNSAAEAGYMAMEGFMEKLPINKRKATLLKTWKRRYFKAVDGNLYYYETSNRDKANGYLTIIGGSIENLGERMLGIDDGRGRYLIVRCPTDNEFKDWKQALTSQTSESIRTAYIQPVLQSPSHKTKKVIIVDIGSCSVRAGILGEQASLPQVFFPTIVAIDKETKKKTLGFDAFKPEVRQKSTLVHPVKPSAMADKYSLNFEIITDIFQKVFAELGVDPSNYLIMLSTPGNYTDKIKEELLNILVKQFKVKGVNIVSQTLLAMYSYSQATSGIVVDIGDRLEIVPITDGFIQEAGKSREAYGGHRIGESLNSCLTEAKYRFFSEVEFTLVRLALEKTCYVSQEYEADEKNCKERPELFREILDLTKYELPAGTWTRITHDLSRFKSPEGLFQPEMWGMDTPALHKLIQKAILACPMDTRREMWRSIFLSGGGTLLSGFAERLQAELTKLVPKSIKVQIHASPQRYHAAYIGACNLASMKVFESACITADEWKKKGAPLLRKWHMY